MTWDERKTDTFLVELKNYKRQKLGEGVDWDSDKVALLESVRKNPGDRWATWTFSEVHFRLAYSKKIISHFTL